jgi:hypothetical protein
MSSGQLPRCNNCTSANILYYLAKSCEVLRVVHRYGGVQPSAEEHTLLRMETAAARACNDCPTSATEPAYPAPVASDHRQQPGNEGWPSTGVHTDDVEQSSLNVHGPGSPSHIELHSALAANLAKKFCTPHHCLVRSRIEMMDEFGSHC